jgi:hypothetical protein
VSRRAKTLGALVTLPILALSLFLSFFTIWHRLTSPYTRLGGWKGVDRMASPCRFKNYYYGEERAWQGTPIMVPYSSNMTRFPLLAPSPSLRATHPHSSGATLRPPHAPTRLPPSPPGSQCRRPPPAVVVPPTDLSS